MSHKIKNKIDAADICERLVGITPIYLQNFIQRGSYGLRSSVNPGKVRSQRRQFSRDDVFGIGLVWLLFEAGLRGDPMVRILKEITGKVANPNLAAKKLLEERAEYLVIARRPRGPTKIPLEKPAQEISIVGQDSPQSIQDIAAVQIAIPVGSKFRDIEMRMELLFPPQGA